MNKATTRTARSSQSKMPTHGRRSCKRPLKGPRKSYAQARCWKVSIPWSRETVLITDASRICLGYVLIQTDEKLEMDALTCGALKKMPKGGFITCGSRCINSAEQNYAMVELELLSLQWATKKARLYLLGAPFKAVTDHQPLVSTVNGRNHNTHSNLRIHCLFAKLIGFNLTLYWTQGKTNIVEDALSWAPV